MSDPEATGASVGVSQQRHRNNLRIDMVVGTQPELGPVPPDGGYGWIILTACFLIQIIAASILSTLGRFLLFSSIESLDDKLVHIWDFEITVVPIFYLISWILTDTWSGASVAITSSPRQIAISSVLLIFGSFIAIWCAEIYKQTVYMYIIVGILLGIGVSFLTQQSHVLLQKYFLKKLRFARLVVQFGNMFGLILVPDFIVNLIMHHGIINTTFFYSIFVATAIIPGLFFTNPKITPSLNTQSYVLLQNTPSEEENEIFKKSHTNTSKENNQDTLSNASRLNWVSFEDEEEIDHSQLQEIKDVDSPNQTNKSSDLLDLDFKLNTASSSNTPNEIINDSQEKPLSPTRKKTQDSFSEENIVNNDNSRSINDQNGPQPLYYDQNTDDNTYSIDNNQVYNTISHNLTQSGINNTLPLRESFKQFLNPTFYKYLLTYITIKLSLFVFWVLGPVVVYQINDHLDLNQVTYYLLVTALIGTFIAMLGVAAKVKNERVSLMLALTFSLSFFGFGEITYGANLITWRTLGATCAVTALHMFEPFYDRLLQQSSIYVDNRHHWLIKATSGIVILIFLCSSNLEFSSIMNIVGFLQFVTSTVWYISIFWKTIKYRFCV